MKFKPGLLTFALAAAGVGAGVGAYSDDQDRSKGALLGAVAGVGLLTAGQIGHNIYKMPKAIEAKGLSKITNRIAKSTKYYGAVAIGGAGALGVGTMMQPDAYQSSSAGTPDGMGGHQDALQYQNYQYSLSDRLATMNVSGDIVFGLHNKRHG